MSDLYELPADCLHNSPWYLPSPAAIQAECRRLQDGWTEAQERQRAGRYDEPWEVPQYLTPGLLD